MKSVLFISPSPTVMGGISSVINGYLATRLARRYEIRLVSSHMDGLKLKKLIIAIYGLIRTCYLLRFYRIDIVHIHCGDFPSPKRKFFYFILAQKFKKKIIFHLHGASFMDQYSVLSAKWKNRIQRVFDQSDQVLCLSHSWKKSVEKIAPKSVVEVLPNGIQPSSLEHKNHLKDFAPGEAQLCFLGLIGKRKGVFDLLDVCKRLIENGFNVHLKIGGSGDVKRLQNRIDELILTENVEFLGWVRGEIKEIILKGSDVFVLPSYGEGMPMSILEAMSFCLPVVTTNVGGIPELVSDGKTGYIVEPGDLGALYEKLKTLIENPQIRIKFGRAGRKFLEEKYDLNRIIPKLEQIYESL